MISTTNFNLVLHPSAFIQNSSADHEGGIGYRHGALNISLSTTEHQPWFLSRDRSFSFLEMPRELRDMVYGLLLSTKHTLDKSTTRNTVSDCFAPPIGVMTRGLALSLNQSNDGILKSRLPDVSRFHTAILHTNRQLYVEASNTFYGQNLFTLVTSSYANFEVCCLGHHLRVFARDRQAASIKRLAMAVSFDPAALVDPATPFIPRRRLWDPNTTTGGLKRTHMVIAAADLSKLCNVLFSFSQDYNNGPTLLQYSRLGVRVFTPSDRALSESMGQPRDMPFVKSLLVPFLSLHSLNEASVTGYVSSKYADEIKQSLCRKPPTALELATTAFSDQVRGSQALLDGNMDLATSMYLSAIDRIHAGFAPGTANTLTGEKFNHKSSTVVFLEIRLGFYIALTEIGLKTGAFRKVHPWTYAATRILNCLRDTDPAVYAQLWYWRSMATEALRGPEAAYRDVSQALSFEPDNLKWSAELRRLNNIIDEKTVEEIGKRS